MRTYVCSGCWMWAPRSGSPAPRPRSRHLHGKQSTGNRTSSSHSPSSWFLLPRGWAGQGHGQHFAPHLHWAGGGVIPFPYRRPSGFCDHAVKCGSGGGGWTRSRVRRSTTKNTSTNQCSYECTKERGRHLQVRPFLVAACRQHAFAEPVRAIVSSVPPTPVHTSSTPAGSNNGTVLFLACL